MKRVKLILAYDGTNYCGWQLQPNGITIEEVLNRSLNQLLQENIQVIGASRTDSGVHALGNVAVFDTESRIPAEKMCFALNQRLPADVVVQESCEVPENWHPRKCNTIKTYEYKILNRRIPDPTVRLNSYFFYMPLDIKLMQQAAQYLIGEHDFKSFCSVRTQAEDTVRTITDLKLEEREDMIIMRISGNGFLYNMVRIIVGTLLKVGTGYYPPEHMEEILDARDRKAAGPKAPAHGLTLISITEEEKLKAEVHITNKYMDYLTVQKEIPIKRKAYIIIYRCVWDDFDSTILRLSKQAIRNGAKEVYFCDCEKRLHEGYQADYFTFHHDTDFYLMYHEKNFPCKMGELTAIRLETLTEKNSQEFLSIYNQAFGQAPHGATYTEKEIQYLLAEESIQAYLVFSDKGEVIGVTEWKRKEKELYLESLGIRPDMQGRGYGKAVLFFFLEEADKRKIPIRSLLVASRNERANRLYETAGFVKKELRSTWYVTEDPRRCE